VFAASYAQLGGGFFAATLGLTALAVAIGLLALRPAARRSRVRSSWVPPPGWPCSQAAWLRLQRARWVSVAIGLVVIVGAWRLSLSDLLESHALLVAGGIVYGLMALLILVWLGLALLGRPRSLVPRELR
jgi:hypothetical protein